MKLKEFNCDEVRSSDDKEKSLKLYYQWLSNERKNDRVNNAKVFLIKYNHLKNTPLWEDMKKEIRTQKDCYIQQTKAKLKRPFIKKNYKRYRKEYFKKYAKKNREKLNKYNIEYYKLNKERLREKRRLKNEN